MYKKGTYTFNKKDILVSVVGTRKVTDYGREVTELLVKELFAAGCVIVSGLAFGVDAVAAEAAITAGGKTIAVLGSGIDLCTPSENQRLYDKILANGGAIVSENHLGMTPNKCSFPARNPIIAGLSRGVLVTEGAKDSGSLITANFAFEFDRKVFAVPGPITSSVSKGPISLISKGAKKVMTTRDIVEELGIRDKGLGSKRKSFKPDSKEEQVILDVLQDQTLHFDELVRRTGFSSSQLGIVLSLMEVKGLIKSLDGGNYGLTT
jgi:DNA processing protein